MMRFINWYGNVINVDNICYFYKTSCKFDNEYAIWIVFNGDENKLIEWFKSEVKREEMYNNLKNKIMEKGD